MTIRTRLNLWFALVLILSLMAMGAISYYELVVEPRSLPPRTSNSLVTEDGPIEEEFEALAKCAIPSILLGLGGGWLLMRRALAPVSALSRAAERITEHHFGDKIPRTGNGDELDRLTGVFNEMTTRLQGSFSRIREFTLHASHELKTPLTIMHAELETALHDESLNEKTRARLESQIDEVQRLGRIVDGLTLLTKADAGQISLTNEPCSLDELVKDAFADAQSLGRDRKISVDLSQCRPVRVAGDRDRLRQLLLNLADNAVKYSDSGGTVRMSLSSTDSAAEFTIENSGPGISPDHLLHVFDPFFRGNATRDGVDGCGLGLSIAQWIAGAHGGKIEITSEPNHVTRAKLRLPVISCLICSALCISMLGCARFQPKPLSAAQSADDFDRRALDSEPLKNFIRTNLNSTSALIEPSDPSADWDFEKLWLAACYYHPDLSVARAGWLVSRAGAKTAAQRPNPVLNVTPGYNVTTMMASPWLPLGSIDLPIETAGKRGKRKALAARHEEATRLNVIAMAWQVRARVRRSLIDLTVARRRSELLQSQLKLQQNISKRLDQQVAAGAIADFEAVPARLAVTRANVDLADGRRLLMDAQAALAENIGVPLRAITNITISTRPFGKPDLASLTSSEARKAAVTGRADILAGLADYSASEAALRLEISKQYPDVHLQPGYEFDQGDSKWSLGLTVELPVLHQNQGPIAEANARREESAAKFLALQAKVTAEVDRSIAALITTRVNFDALAGVSNSLSARRDSLRKQFNAGAINEVEMLSADLEVQAGELALFDGEVKIERAIGAVEDAIQRPVETMRVASQMQTVK
jgi:signal transduction histidine kinase/outer membrane protein TolC